MTYRDLVEQAYNRDMRIVSMVGYNGGILIATATQVYFYDGDCICPLEIDEGEC